MLLLFCKTASKISSIILTKTYLSYSFRSQSVSIWNIFTHRHTYTSEYSSFVSNLRQMNANVNSVLVGLQYPVPLRIRTEDHENPNRSASLHDNLHPVVASRRRRRSSKFMNFLPRLGSLIRDDQRVCVQHKLCVQKGTVGWRISTMQRRRSPRSFKSFISETDS